MAYISQSLIDPGGTGDYINMTLWEAGEQEDLPVNDVLAKVHTFSSDGTADVISSTILISGWGNTNAENYVHILCTGSDSHDGILDQNKYRLENTRSNQIYLSNTMLKSEQAYTRIEGLQFDIETQNEGVVWGMIPDSSHIFVNRCLFRCSASIDAFSGGETGGIQASYKGTNDNIYTNNLIYYISGSFGIPAGIRITIQSGSVSAFAYNNTVVINKTPWGSADNILQFVEDGYDDFPVGVSGSALAINNIGYGQGVALGDFILTGQVGWHESCSNNISMDDSSAPGINSHWTASVDFVNTASTLAKNENYGLTNDDVYALNGGKDLSADPFHSFSIDIRNNEWEVPWNIGAFGNLPFVSVPRETLLASIYNSGRENTLKATMYGHSERQYVAIGHSGTKE